MQFEKYPKNWKEIAFELKKRAGWKCSMCAHYNDVKGGYALTVHHVDGDPENNYRSNLVVVCQRCHLKLEHERRRRLRQEVEVRMGQGFLFGGG